MHQLSGEDTKIRSKSYWLKCTFYFASKFQETWSYVHEKKCEILLNFKAKNLSKWNDSGCLFITNKWNSHNLLMQQLNVTEYKNKWLFIWIYQFFLRSPSKQAKRFQYVKIEVYMKPRYQNASIFQWNSQKETFISRSGA